MEKRVESIDNKAIGQRIRESRENLGLTRDELAELIDVSSYYLGQLERGERQMSLPVMIRVASCLHISLDFMILGITTREEAATGNIDDLINKCSTKEIELVKKLIKTILPYMK